MERQRAPMRAPSKPRRMVTLLALLGVTWSLAAAPVAAQDAETPPAAPPPDAPAAPPPDAPAAPAPDAPAAAPDSPAAAPAPRRGATGSRSSPAKQRRGGVNPCMTPDPGWGTYDTWSREPSMGQMIMPAKGGIRKNGGFDLIVHFHGHEPIRKEFVKASTGVVLVGIDLGIGSGVYASSFAAPHTFQRLIESVQAAVARKTGKKNAHVRKLGLSSWSAGYGAIEQILRQPIAKKVDALILLDSLHAGYADEQAKTLKVAQIEPFIEFARRAAAGKTFMFMSHSSIIPPGYASTTEVADFVIKALKGKPKRAKRQDVLGLDMIDRYDRGNFHVRGYTGDDKPDHCAHIGLIAGVMKVHLGPRWKTPKGRK